MSLPASKKFSGIFISYRRDDSVGHAGRLYDRLSDHFGGDQIFMDIDQIEPGEDFVHVIEDGVGSCEILIAVIGRRWLVGADGATRRLDDPNDFVRLEIAAAFRRDIRVIPVLVEGAVMPMPRDLPEDLSPLSRRQAIELSDQRWKYDVDRLIEALEKILARQREARHIAAQEEAERRRTEEESRQAEESERLKKAAEAKRQRREAEEAERSRLEAAERGRRRGGESAPVVVGMMSPASVEGNYVSVETLARPAAEGPRRAAIIAAVVALLVVAGVVLVIKSRQAQEETASPEHTGTTPMPTPQAVKKTFSEAEVIEQEKLIWDALKRKDYDAFARMLADELVVVGSTGVTDKPGVITTLKGYTITDVSLSDWRVVPLVDEAAVVTYKAVVKSTATGRNGPATLSRVSSVWLNRGGKWLVILNQDTEINEPVADHPPGAPRMGSGTLVAATLPAAGATEAADPVEQEKQLWDSLKRKDYDAFASHLDDHLIEVEPEGIYDKAGMVGNAKGGEWDVVSPGGFKEVKIDAATSIVTYLMTGAARNQKQWCSTVWTQRGAWRALFHQGSPQAPPPK
ncbi:MAG TPA: DUF4440 domain-containing protein [Pyrinomonadaceae bacterium]|nr:DUF4440 domain-containing protein [Pyrinomonadaceae bacterium]